MPHATKSIAQKDPLRVLQITDTHLYADPASCLLGLNTQSSLEQVLSSIRDRHLPADLVLVTGDLVHDCSEAGYRRLHRMLLQLEAPAYCIPGNHDEALIMRRILNGSMVRSQPCARRGAWAFAFVDSTVAGEDGGHLSEPALQRLAACLAANRDRQVLVCLHHQPVPVGSAWLDTMAVDNPQDFWRVIDAAPQVRGVVWGHVHQVFEAMRGDLRLLASPSTCIQFAPGTETFGIDQLPPGYRWFELHPDGRIASGVERVDGFAGMADAAAGGY